MARCPFAAWRPLPQNASSPSITPRLFVYHTNVGASVLSTERYFSGGSNGIESHFGIACPKCEAAGIAQDGAIWQWMDTNKRADAQLDANGFALSVETCDHYSGGTYTNPALSPAQVNSWIRLGNWAAQTHHIPRQRASAWDGRGFGYHSMWGAPSHWTNAAGKTCPNPTRIKQFNDTVLPAIVSGTEGDWFSMATLEELRTAVQAELMEAFGKRWDDNALTVTELLGKYRGEGKGFWAMLDRIDVQTAVTLDDEAKVLTAVNAVQSQVGNSRDAVLAALAALDVSLTDEQIAQLASQINVDETAVAEAVRFRLAEALAA